MRTPTLLPDTTELCLDHLVSEPHSLTMVVQAARESVLCPDCHQPTRRIHSRYTRLLADLPWNGVAVRIRLHTRKFFCSSLTCSRRIFTERLPATAVRYARRTTRLAESLQLLGLTLGGEAGARMAKQLGLRASPDTLLRRMRQAKASALPIPRVLGVDDWAWRKGQQYGTILVDLERRRVVDLLPDRQAETFANWLREHPGVELISRDRAGAYAEGARQGAPKARQIADRWHLLANLSESVRKWLERRRALLQQVMAVAMSEEAVPSAESTATPELWLAFERRRKQAAERSRAARLERYQQVRLLRQQGASERVIARQLRISRKVVRRFLASEQFPERAARQTRPPPLAPYQDSLRRRWTEGCHNAAQLLREIQAQGYGGKRSSVRDFVARWRETKQWPPRRSMSDPRLRAPSPPSVALLLLRPSEQLPAEQQSFVDLLTAEQEAREVRELGQQFVQMIRERQRSKLDDWIKPGAESAAAERRRFAAGLKRDYAAVSAALEEPWSKGPVEGQVPRLKLIKCQMYGRGKLDLLRVRLQHAA